MDPPSEWLVFFLSFAREPEAAEKMARGRLEPSTHRASLRRGDRPARATGAELGRGVFRGALRPPEFARGPFSEYFFFSAFFFGFALFSDFAGTPEKYK